MDNKELEMLLPYCENDMKRLKSISRSIFLRYNEELSQADYDDFYSIANMTLWQAYEIYEYRSDVSINVSFDLFLRGCLKKKFATEIRDRHREKRFINQCTIPLDAKNDNDDECNLLDFVPADFDTFDEVMKMQEQYTDKTQVYISRLSNQQINILNLLIDGYKPQDIREKLDISASEYANNLKTIRAYENVRVLF